MKPQAEPLQPPPEMLQVTAVFVVPLTVTVNCWLAPVITWAVSGETLSATGPVMVTFALADLVESA
jgi:hypothetical protein